jgi:pimeloyl-ACP methyl ester carboxylesterase
MKLYAISGLGADERAFQLLNINAEIEYIDWLTPTPNETLKSYALRMADQIDTSEPFMLMGVSFGGMLSTEISKVHKPVKTILISSAETRKELPRILKLYGAVNASKWLPDFAYQVPRPLAAWFFGTNEPEVLSVLLDDVDIDFVRWAVHAIATWDNKVPGHNIHKVYGQSDRILPSGGAKDATLIDKAQHLMIIDRADEVSAFINEIIAGVKTAKSV